MENSQDAQLDGKCLCLCMPEQKKEACKLPLNTDSVKYSTYIIVDVTP